MILLDKYISQIEEYQQEVLAVLIELNFVDIFENIDALVANK